MASDAHKEYARKYMRSRWRTHRERLKKIRRKYMYKKKYNLSVEQYIVLLSKQGGGCAICGAIQPDTRTEFLHVDHDHLTKKVRGLLCTRCNQGLGYFLESPALFRKAILYLEVSLGL